MFLWRSTSGVCGKVDNLSPVFVDNFDLYAQQVEMTYNSDSGEGINPLIKQFKLTAYSQKAAGQPVSSSQIAPKPNSTLTKLASVLNALALSNLMSFDRELQCYWNDPPIDDRHNQRLADRSLRFLEANAVEMVLEGIRRCEAISMSHEALIIFMDALSESFSNCGSVVQEYSSGATKVGLDDIVSDAKLAEIRRRMDRRIDAYGSRFVDVLETPAHHIEKEQDKGGRPPESNWDDMETYVLSQYPEGIPKARGTKAKIREFMEHWLLTEFRTLPSKRQLQRQASKIYDKY